jgi:hypothetical protein
MSGDAPLPEPRAGILPSSRGWQRRLALLAVLAGLALASLLAVEPMGAALEALLDLRALAREAGPGHPAVLAALLLYAALIAVPFVPGAELGLVLLALFGAAMAGPVWLATVAGLTLAFTLGRLVPERVLRRLPFHAGLDRARTAVQAAGRPDASPVVLPAFAARLVRWRCCGLVLLINTPGNTLIGGGGGIAAAAGASRLFGLGEFVLTAVIAVAPVPVAILIADRLT